MASNNQGPAILPERTNPEDLLKGFCDTKMETVNIHSVSRPELMLLLAQKHRLLATELGKEKEILDEKCKKMGPILEDSRKKRDDGNSSVRSLKNKRGKLYTEIRVLREQFFSLLEKADELEDSAGQAKKIKKDIDDLDWKIQTEAVTINQEREFLDKIKSFMESMSQARLDYQKKAGIESRVKEIAESIGKRTAEAEETHHKLLEEVKGADIAHAMVKRLEPIVGPATRRSEWLGHRTQLHIESAEYWEDRAKREPKQNGGDGPGK